MGYIVIVVMNQLLKKLTKQDFLNAFKVAWFLAVRQIRRSSKWTTGLIILIMTLTFLNLVVVSGLLLGLISGSFVQFKNSYAGDVIITSAPGKSKIENSYEIIKYLENYPDVKNFSPRYIAGSSILGTLDRLPKKDEKANKANISIVGIDPETEQRQTNFSQFIIHGKMLDKNDTNGILIGANMIKKYSAFADANIPGLTFLDNIDIGSRLRVTINSAGGSLPVTKDFYLRGIVKSKVDEISTRAFINADEMKRLLGANNQIDFQEIAISIAPPNDRRLINNLNSFFDGNNLPRIQAYEDAIPSFLRQIEQTMGLLGNALSLIGLVVATITIFIVIFINAFTKRKFIGIMKGIGISPLAIELSYVIQAGFFGIIGSGIGAVITFGLLKPYFDANPINFPFSDGILVVTAEGAILRIVILMFVTIIAGYVPAHLIVKRNTLDAILGR